VAKVTIVGAGVMGTAIAWPLTDNGHQVRLVGTHLDDAAIESCLKRGQHPRLPGRLPSSVMPRFVEELPASVADADIVVTGVSSPGVRWVGQQIGPHLRAGQVVIAVTKGLEVSDEGDLRILPDVMTEAWPATLREKVPVAAIGGPCIAGELAVRRETCVLFGCPSAAVLQQLAATFRTRYYHVWPFDDWIGLEICAALKNAYAIGVGLAEGLPQRSDSRGDGDVPWHNLAAAVFAQACREMAEVLRLQALDPGTAYGPAGAGDLHVTCQGGRNVTLGRWLGSGLGLAEAQRRNAGETTEGVDTVRVMDRALRLWQQRGRAGESAFPLLRTLIAVLVEDQRVALTPAKFFGGEAVTVPSTSAC